MNELANFWNIIVESNTFNFAVLLVIFAVLYKKMNVADGIEKIYPYIVKHNPAVIKNPNNVPAGTTIKIPKLKKKQ